MAIPGLVSAITARVASRSNCRDARCPKAVPVFGQSRFRVPTQKKMPIQLCRVGPVSFEWRLVDFAPRCRQIGCHRKYGGINRSRDSYPLEVSKNLTYLSCMVSTKILALARSWPHWTSNWHECPKSRAERCRWPGGPLTVEGCYRCDSRRNTLA